MAETPNPKSWRRSSTAPPAGGVDGYAGRDQAGHLLLRRQGQEPGGRGHAQRPGLESGRKRTGSCPRTGSRSSWKACKDRLERFRSFKLFMDICVRCGACADKCHFFIGSGDPEEHAGVEGRAPAVGLPQELHRRPESSWDAWPGPGPHPAGPEGVVVATSTSAPNAGAARSSAPTASTGRDHHHGPGTDQPARPEHRLDRGAGGQLQPHRKPPGHPAPCLQGHDRFLRGRDRGADRYPGGAQLQPQGGRNPVHHPVGRRLCRSGHLHLPWDT